MTVFPDNHPVLIYDGDCSFCNYWVQFVLQKDKRNRFYFLNSRKEEAVQFLAAFDLSDITSQTVIVYNEDKLYLYSDAVLFIMKELGYGLRFFGYIIPKFLRDGLYNRVAKHRYKITMWNRDCIVPDEEQKKRFL